MLQRLDLEKLFLPPSVLNGFDSARWADGSRSCKRLSIKDRKAATVTTCTSGSRTFCTTDR